MELTHAVNCHDTTKNSQRYLMDSGEEHNSGSTNSFLIMSNLIPQSAPHYFNMDTSWDTQLKGANTYLNCATGWRKGSVVRTSVVPYAWSMVTASWVNCPLWVKQSGQLSLPSLQGRYISSSPCNYSDYGGGDHETADQGFVWSQLVGTWLACSLLDERPLCLWHNSTATAAVCGL